jgi:hypothetical protein
MTSFVLRVATFARARWDYSILLVIVIAVAAIAAVLLGPHVVNSYNNIVPNGSE